MKFWMRVLISGLILFVVVGCGSNVEYDKPNNASSQDIPNQYISNDEFTSDDENASGDEYISDDKNASSDEFTSDDENASNDEYISDDENASSDTNGSSLTLSPSDQDLKDLYDSNKSDVQVQGVGTVTKILADDLKGDKHQRFILKLASGQTLLMAHNIDLAPRIDSIAVGDSVEFFGEYVWNKEGGIIHWTHIDPNSVHVDGWLKHEGVTYQ